MTPSEFLSFLEKALKLPIILFGLIMAYAEFAQAYLYKKSFIKWGLGFCGLYWSVCYTYSLLVDHSFGKLPECPQVFFRAGILLTIALVAAGALMTLKELRRLKR